MGPLATGTGELLNRAGTEGEHLAVDFGAQRVASVNERGAPLKEGQDPIDEALDIGGGDTIGDGDLVTTDEIGDSHRSRHSNSSQVFNLNVVRIQPNR